MDISDTMEEKLRALALHKSQFAWMTNFESVSLTDHCRIVAAFRGLAIGRRTPRDSGLIAFTATCPISPCSPEGPTMRTRSDLVRLLDASGVPFETVTSGRCWMIVAPALAARIMGAGVGEENAFWVPPVISTKGWEAGGNVGGQRTWIAPEGGPSGFFFSSDGTRWSVPAELDPGSWRAAPAAAGWKKYHAAFTARSADRTSRKITLDREMSIEEAATDPGSVLRIHFRHTLVNAGSTPLAHRIGLWSLIQLPCEQEGVIFATGSPKPRPYFGTLPRVTTAEGDPTLRFRVKGGTRYKAGMSPVDFAGTIGFVRHARAPEGGTAPLTLTAMRFRVDPAGTYVDKASHVLPGAPPNGDAAQIYCDAGTGDLAFCEIEAHAPAPSLAPGESQGQDIAITIARIEERDLPGFMAGELGIESWRDEL